MKTMKSVGMAVLAMAAVIASQMALTGVLGFHTAEVMGKTAVTALFLYQIIRMGRREREAA